MAEKERESIDIVSPCLRESNQNGKAKANRNDNGRREGEREKGMKAAGICFVCAAKQKVSENLKLTENQLKNGLFWKEVLSVNCNAITKMEG